MKTAIASILILALTLAACAQAPTAPLQKAEQQRITVGGIYTLSGDYADFLKGAATGTRMAVDDFKAQSDLDVTFIEEDDKSCADKTGPVNKLVSVDGVQAILGTTCSSMTLAMAPVTEPAKTIVISGVSTSSAVSAAGDYVFRTISSDGMKSVKTGEEIKRNGYTRIAYVYGNGNDATVTTITDTKKALEGSQAETVLDQAVPDQEADFRTVLLKVQSAKPDAIVIAFTDPKTYGLFLTQFDQLNLERIPMYVPIETIESEDVIKVAGKSAEGVLYPFFAEPSGSQYNDFKRRYKERFGEDAPAYAAESYDAAMITLKAIAQSDGTREDAQRQMFVVGNNYQGVSGIITFDQNGDVTKPLVMKTIKDGKFVVLG